jgi:YggT family protein
MDIVIVPLLNVISIALTLYWYVVVATIIFSWLMAFGVINTYNHAVRTIGEVLARLTEPALKPIRRVMPNFGAIDLSPIVLFLAIYFLQEVIARLTRAAALGL